MTAQAERSAPRSCFGSRERVPTVHEDRRRTDEPKALSLLGSRDPLENGLDVPPCPPRESDHTGPSDLDRLLS
jgi:hypothetical protein